MKIEVGKTYRHSSGNGRFKIEVQWNENLFEGRAIDSHGNLYGFPYLFNVAGEALGYRGNTAHASLGWSLKDNTTEHEYRLIYDGVVDTSWLRLTKSQPRYTYETSKFIVREKNNHNSTRLVSLSEFKELQKKAPTL